MSTTKRITKRLLAVVLTVMMLMSMVTIGITSASAAKVELAETGVNVTGGETFYLNAQNWGYSDARYAMYLCNGSSAATWVNMTLVPGTTYMFQATAPAGQNHKNIIFVRMNGAKPANDWANKWNQTGDLTWNGTSNCFKPSGWDGSTTTWSTYTPPVLPKDGDASGWALMGDTLPGGDWATGLSMVYAENLTVATYTIEDLPAGTYSFKVKNGSTWKAPSTTISPAAGGTIGTDADGNVTLTATGGDYTFNYKIADNTMTIAYTPLPVDAPAAPTAVTFAAIDTAGNGTADAPFVVKAGTEFDITVTPEMDADGFNFTVDGEAQTGNSFKVTAPEAGTTATYEVSVVAYNTNGVEEKESEALTATVYVQAEAEVAEVVYGTKMDASDWFKADGLYAYAASTDTEIGPDAWQRWDSVSGKDYRYFYLPATVADDTVIIYNNYDSTIVINGTQISAGCYNFVPYENGTVYACEGADTQSVKIMKSDAEGAIYINNPATEYADENKNTISNTDLYAFLTGGTKNREAKGTGAVASVNDGVIDKDIFDEEEQKWIDPAGVKKIKGRGNSTWKLAKKPFNITFSETIKIDGMKGKKWSLLANAQDPSLLRNRLVYDLANEVNMTYACDSRFVDWFVNGDYKGSYQLTQKIEMGKNTVMPDLEEPEVEDVVEDDGTITPYPKENFDFILELDTAENAAGAGDLTFTTSRGQVMTHKTPDEPAAEQVAFMKAKYQAVEDALYTGDIATLETLVDLDDFARAYLINEVAKNLDAGVTSCYFTYNSETGKFTTAPVWDYDNALGNSVSIADRHDASGNMLDVTGPSGWYARDLMHYAISNTLNVFGQACATTSTNAAGETFNDVVKRIWNDEFMPALAVLEGTATATNGRLDTVAGYMANLKDSGKWNYDYAKWELTANNGWVANHGSLVMYNYDAEANTLTKESKTYDQYTLEGQANYAGDWLISRMNWLAAQYNEAEEEALPLPEAKDGYMRIFFTNEWMWSDVKIYIWNSATTSANNVWPGEPMEFYENNGSYDVYYAYVPEDAYFIFNGIKDDGSGTRDQSPDIKSGAEDGLGYAMTWDDKNQKNDIKTYDDYQKLIETPEDPTEEPTEKPTDKPTEGPTEDPNPATPDEPGTITIYFTNNWKWRTGPYVYYWFADNTNNKFPGTEMTYVDTDADGNDRYSVEIPTNITGMLFNGQHAEKDETQQSVDITEGWYDGIGYYMEWKDNANNVGTYTYEPIEKPTEEPTEEPTEGPTEDPTEDPNPATPDVPDMPTVITVYAINSANWEEVYAYCWDGNGVDNAWPGVAMDKTEETVNGFDVYALSFDSSFVNVIFNNNDKGAQTADLTATDGQYYDIKGGKWYESLEDVPGVDPLAMDCFLVGSFNNWSTTATEFKKANAEDTYGTITLTLTEGEEISFKIVREGKWTSPKTEAETVITDSVTNGIVFSSNGIDGDAGNVKLTAKDAGEYVFTFDIATSKLTVAYPGSDVVVPEPPVPDTTVKLAGSFTDWEKNPIEMTLVEGSETVYSTELRLEAGKHTFKIIEFGTWLGNNGTIESDACEGWTFRNGTDAEGNEYGNCTLPATGGTYTFTFDTTTDKLTITSVLDEIETPVYDIVFLNDGNHYTHNAPATADEGSSFQFTITPEEDYKVVAVIADMLELTADENGVYTYNDVTGSVQIMVFVTEDTSNDTPIIPDEPETEPPTEEPTEEPKTIWTVMFVDDSNNIIEIQKVEDGAAATAPQAPAKAGYTFEGWSQNTDVVTGDMLVVANYKKITTDVPAPVITTGKLLVEISGGTGFTIDGRPQGTSYMNTKIEIGTPVTLVAKTTNGNEFMGWMNATTGVIVSTTETLEFTASGGDFFKAVYKTSVDSVNLVVFKNDTAANGKGQILDMQYYAAGDEVVFPADAGRAGYEFTGWNHTAEQIQTKLAAGQDVTVLPTWKVKAIYLNITVNNGTIVTSAPSNGNGGYLYNNAMVVKANAAPDGQKFAYWVDQNGDVKSYNAEYKFFVYFDTELTPVYVDVDETIEYQAIVGISANTTVDDVRIGYSYFWEVPAELGTFVQGGVLVVEQKNYNPATFIAGVKAAGLDANVTEANARDAQTNPLAGYTSNKTGSQLGTFWYAKSYVQYRDANGDIQTVYSDMIEAAKN